MGENTTYTPTRLLDARSGARVPRQRQSPDWRIARHPSGEWRSRETSFSLVPKMPHAAEHHGHAQLVGRRYDIGLKYGLLTAQLALALSGQDRDEVLSNLVELLARRTLAPA